MANYRNGRKLISVTMTPELHTRVIEHCKSLDLPVSVWCRKTIESQVKVEERKLAKES